MDPMDVYTPYTLLFAALNIACILFSAGWNAYYAVKLKKNRLFVVLMLMQSTLLAWLALKLFELTAPNVELMYRHIYLQKGCAIFLACVLALFCAGLLLNGPNRKITQVLCASVPVVIACAAVPFFKTFDLFWDITPVLCFTFIELPVIFTRQDIFAELSPASIDGFIDNLDDPILLFDCSGHLMDSNACAKRTFDLEETVTQESFIRCVNQKIISGKMLAVNECPNSSRLEISIHQKSEGPPAPLHSVFLALRAKKHNISGGFQIQTSGEVESPSEAPMFSSAERVHFTDEIRTYLYGRTISVNRKKIPIAVVLTFHDITERTRLLQELESKNKALDRLNIQLKIALAAADQLAEEEEKNLAVMEIQQALEGSIAELLEDFQTLKNKNVEDTDEFSNKLGEITNKSRIIIKEIRQVIEKLYIDEERNRP